MQETQETSVQSLIREDPLEKEMAPYCSIFAWKIPWAEEPSGLQSMGSQEVRHDLVTKALPQRNKQALVPGPLDKDYLARGPYVWKHKRKENL